MPNLASQILLLHIGIEGDQHISDIIVIIYWTLAMYQALFKTLYSIKFTATPQINYYHLFQIYR